jgi:hypothetical protein
MKQFSSAFAICLAITCFLSQSLKSQTPGTIQPSRAPRFLLPERISKMKSPPFAGPNRNGLYVVSPADPSSVVLQDLFGGGCYGISNIQMKGFPTALGYFDGGTTNIQISHGMVLSTGYATAVQGGNTDPGLTSGYGSNAFYDNDLATITTAPQFDLASIEFDINVSNSMLSFQFVYGSEEFCEFINTNFADPFGIFISGPGINGVQNIALVPNTNQPVNVNTVNFATNPNYYVNNNPWAPCSNLPPFAINECQLDGWTKVLTAASPMLCGTYHVKIAIADSGDGLYDSAVFVKASTDIGQGTVSATPIYPNGQNYGTESCHSGDIQFNRAWSNTFTPQTVQFTVSGTATPGIDYTPLPSTIIIPASQNSITVPVFALEDNLIEGDETIEINLVNSCTCGEKAIFHIKDTPPLDIALAGGSICSGASAMLSPVVTGGQAPYIYAWNNGSTAPKIIVQQLGTYTVTITDMCGYTKTAEATVNGIPAPPLNLTVQFCEGDSATVNGQVFTNSGSVMYIKPGLNGQCDTAVTVTILKVQQYQKSLQLSLCPKESYTTSSGIVHHAPETFNEIHQGLNGACDTVKTVKLIPAPPVSIKKSIPFCPGGSVTIGGITYHNPGIVNDTIPGMNGDCDTAVVYSLMLTTAPSTPVIKCPKALAININSGDSPQPVTYPPATATSNCPCPGLNIEQTTGLATGSIFPIGITSNCFKVTDACGHTASCCFDVKIKELPACDIKEEGLAKWEILSVLQDGAGFYHYKIRVTNGYPNALTSAIFQIPNGIVATTPGNNATYISPGGRAYSVKNPAFDIIYSISFQPQQPGIANGQSDIFQYTLPPQTDVTFINVILEFGVAGSVSSTLNTFNCMNLQRSDASHPDAGAILYPNPNDGTFSIEIPYPVETIVPIRILDMKGMEVHREQLTIGAGAQPMILPEKFPTGIYVLEIKMPDGTTRRHRFVLQH